MTPYCPRPDRFDDRQRPGPVGGVPLSVPDPDRLPDRAPDPLTERDTDRARDRDIERVATRGVGPRRGAGTGPRVAVTGAGGPVGRALLTALRDAPGIGRVLALDRVPVAVEGVRSVLVDVCDPSVGSALAGCDVVVHLDPDPVLALAPGARPGDVETAHAALDGPLQLGDVGPGDPVPPGRAVLAAQTVLTAAAATSVRCAILVTSAMVYGAGAALGVPVEEDAPLLAHPDGRVLRDLLDVERVAGLAAAHRGLEVCVVRPAALAGPGVDSAVTRYFEAPRLVTVKGAPMRWQFCHLDDLVSALVVAVRRGRGGVATVGCEGWLSQAEAQRLSGRAGVELPESLAHGAADRLHRLGLTPVPPGQLRYVTRSWVVPSTTLRDAGWRPAWDNAAALAAVLEQNAGHTALAWRRIGRRETATIGAAGATVAVVTAAALVARARRNRQR